MKKLHFSLLAILFALFAMLSITACSSDDDDTPSAEFIKENIVGGRWIPTHVSGWEYVGGSDEVRQVDKDITLGQDDYDALTFKSDMTMTYLYYSKNYWKQYDEMKYRINGNKLTTYDDKYGDDEVEDVVTIISVDSQNMVVEYDFDEEDYPGKKVRLTYKKVN